MVIVLSTPSIHHVSGDCSGTVSKLLLSQTASVLMNLCFFGSSSVSTSSSLTSMSLFAATSSSSGTSLSGPSSGSKARISSSSSSYRRLQPLLRSLMYLVQRDLHTTLHKNHPIAVVVAVVVVW